MWQPGLLPGDPQNALAMPVCWYNSGTRSRSTGKERDSETGLDFFGARYFSAAQGRFTTPDWSATPQPVPYADLTDPQTLNLYSYVRNNPLAKADVDGHCWPLCTVLGGAAVGAVIGGGGEIIAQKLQGKSIDWNKVKGATAKGAILGAAIGLAGPEAGAGTAALLGAGGNLVGGIADRTIQGKSAKEVLSPTAVGKDAVVGAVGGALGAKAEAAGEAVAQGSAKVAAASGDQEMVNFFTNNTAAIGTGTAKATDLATNTAESYHGDSASTNQQQQLQDKKKLPQ
jgi:RHS repeat-associated protein